MAYLFNQEFGLVNEVLGWLGIAKVGWLTTGFGAKVVVLLVYVWQNFGFTFLMFIGGIAGILAASLMNINAPYRPEGTKMAALGFATACVLGTLIALVGSIALLGAR